MTTTQPSQTELMADTHEQAISFAHMVDFFVRVWKKLVLALVIGALLGLGFGFLIGTYSAEYIFYNQIQNVLEEQLSDVPDVLNQSASRTTSGLAGTKNTMKTDLAGAADARVQNPEPMKTSAYAIDIASWKAIQKALPAVAAQVVASGKVPPDQANLYRDLVEESWWKKNAIPSFLAVTKVDTKDIAGTIKDLDPDSFVLLSVTLTETGRTAEGAIKNVQGAAQFLRSAGAYIQIRNLLNSYDAETIGTSAELQKRITNAKIEIDFLQERLSKLEQINKRFPNNGSATQAVLNPKDSSAKYLPLPTQMIATQNEINTLQESVVRNSQRISQLRLIQQFLEQAKPLANQTFDGLELVGNLLKIQAQLQSQLPSHDLAGAEALERIQYQLRQIEGRFTKGLEPLAIIKTTGIATAMIAGAVITFLLVFLGLLARQAWLHNQRTAM